MTNMSPEDLSTEATISSASRARLGSLRLFLIPVAMIAFVGTVGVLLYALMAPPRAETGNDFLTVGGATSHRVVPSAHRVVASAELVNNSPWLLSVIAPLIRPVGSGVHVLYTEITEATSAIADVPTDAPSGFTTVSPRTKVAAVVGLEIDCSLWNVHKDWPSDETTVDIVVSGHGSAKYSFQELFGTEVSTQIRELCGDAK